ncbi:ABC transporter ATP-binding protein [Rhizobium lentis]|uniref:ABC-type Fe3+/spermidine/putrescine transport system ATPase subunit n=1 Tax=Rhizobium lentis TaxID=1138194 RepID=A0A7W8XK72_9HYPH|nr:ABC transporter ATP-binding protein [Rhizobium lentis]MBB4577242.1 ABC-type Fe3+/spermidine/putrescine transport system ATPase subunit [Rhizobium lentis]MBB5553805.1 ABC-type Fe3+/spermidine/putrescine transport system ATPase subunit [Rhizobium lentis]MBB5564366.1 ABC-type Fe3+/spermidine/putrescine transport system ATPase subunit [Rhizobium lentis]MBB5570834.1 ABC-type Fe3+/spermidine/putrescine transport system ATPase subunit [Rhizobium lentis]
MTQSVVSLRNIRKTYGDYVAVENFSLEMHHGEIVCLLGPSGCGKTTTLRMVAGFVEPTGGAVLISGNDVTVAPPYRRDTGMVFQSYGLFPHMTVEQNIAFGLDNRKMEKAAKRRRVDEMLNLTELEAMRRRYPKELSGGQQQRVALARALAVRPAVLLLDEPFSNLDAQLRLRLREEMHSLIKRVNITTLFVTHDQEEALAIADKIVVMSKGAVEQTGTPSEIYDAPKTRFVAEFIGACNVVPARTDSSGQLVLDAELKLPFDAPVGDAVAMIRPEAIKLATGLDKEPVFKATVVSSSYLGYSYRTVIRIGSLNLLMDGRFPSEISPAPGASLSVTIDPRRVKILRPSEKQ